MCQLVPCIHAGCLEAKVEAEAEAEAEAVPVVLPGTLHLCAHDSLGTPRVAPLAPIGSSCPLQRLRAEVQ